MVVLLACECVARCAVPSRRPLHIHFVAYGYEDYIWLRERARCGRRAAAAGAPVLVRVARSKDYISTRTGTRTRILVVR